MPQIDKCHWQFVRSLEKQDWFAAAKPFILRLDEDHWIYIDISASKYQSGKQDAIMVVELKCFLEKDDETTDLYAGLGQYFVYRNLLRQFEIPHPLYLAVPTHAYYGVIQRMAVLPLIAENGIKMIIVDLEREEIEQWLE